MLSEMSLHSKRVLYAGRNYRVTICTTDFDPDNIMSLDFASFAVTHKKVKFFTKMVDASINLKTGELDFDDEDGLFGNRHVIVPPEVVALLPFTVRGQALSEMNQLFVPELDEDGSDLLLRVPEIVIDALTDDIEGQGGKFKDLKFKASVTRTYFARTIAQLTRAEIKIVNSMSLNLIAMLKEVDPQAVEEIMKLMQEDSESENDNSSKADAFINIKISVDHPELAEKLSDVRTKQMIKRLSLMMKLPVEFLSDIYDTIPNGDDIIDKIDNELRGIKEKEEDEDKKEGDADKAEEPPISTDVKSVGTIEPDDTEEPAEEPEELEQQTVTVEAETLDEHEDEDSSDDDEENSLSHEDDSEEDSEESTDEEYSEPEESDEEELEVVPKVRKTRKPRVTTPALE